MHAPPSVSDLIFASYIKDLLYSRNNKMSQFSNIDLKSLVEHLSTSSNSGNVV